jgi:type 1 glutamine amidotransferase
MDTKPGRAPGPGRALILSGGVAHDFATTTASLAELLGGQGFDCTVLPCPNDLSDLGDAPVDLLCLNCVWWTCDQTPDWREQWHFELSAAARQAFLSLLHAGTGVLALHAATICFDDWPVFPEVLGAHWDWGVSGHAPFQEHRVRIEKANPHPVTAGLADFTVADELYTDPVTVRGIRPLFTGEWDGRRHPLAWAHAYDRARVFYNGLGHGPEAFAHPVNRLVLQRAAQWCYRAL